MIIGLLNCLICLVDKSLPCVPPCYAKHQIPHEVAAPMHPRSEDLRLVLPEQSDSIDGISAMVGLGEGKNTITTGNPNSIWNYPSKKPSIQTTISVWGTCNFNLMLYGCSCSPFAPCSKRWKSLSVFWLCFPWEPQAASCRTPSWIGWEAESISTALAISAAVSTCAEPLPTMLTRVSNSKLWPEDTGPSLHLLALAPLPGKTVLGSGKQTTNL